MVATSLSSHNCSYGVEESLETTQMEKNIDTRAYPDWYCPESGICRSKFPAVDLPKAPFLDIVSRIFSYNHCGVSALVDSSSGFSISYSVLFPLVKSMAGGLHEMGVKQGDVVLILLPNSIYFPVVLLGVLYLGAIVTPMNPLSSLSEIKKQTVDSNAGFAFATRDRVEKVIELGIPAISVPESFDFNSNAADFSTFYKLISSDPGLAPTPFIRQQDSAAILYSSGTTGACKGVVLTHSNFIATAELFVRFEASQYDFVPSDTVYLAVLPMFHIYGLSLFSIGLLTLGTTVIVMRKFDADDMTTAIERFKVTHFPAVPPLLAALTRKSKDAAGRFGSLKQVSSGAAPITTKSIEEFLDALPHVDFIQGYGMTETTAVATRGYNSGRFRNYTSVGLLAPNNEAKVVDHVTGLFVPPGSMGELWLRGPGNMKGYLNNVEATKSAIDEDGWLRTGDIVCFDRDGYLYVIDRLKEVIKFKGFQVAPAELESVLTSHSDILDAAVIGARDDDAGEIPVAYVVRRAGSAVSEADILIYVAKQVAPYKKVRKVVFTGRIPRSAAGKILRRELRELFASRL